MGVWKKDLLQQFLYRGDNFELILETSGGGWIDGGCQILADALVEWLGEGAEPYYLMGGMYGAGEEWPEHAVVRYGSVYLDGDGASSEEELVARWAEEEHWAIDGYLEVGTEAIRKTGYVGGIPENAAVSHELALRLQAEFPIIPWPKPEAVVLV